MIIILMMVKQKQYNTMARPQEQSHEHYRILSVQKEEKREYAKSRWTCVMRKNTEDYNIWEIVVKLEKIIS